MLDLGLLRSYRSGVKLGLGTVRMGPRMTLSYPMIDVSRTGGWLVRTFGLLGGVTLVGDEVRLFPAVGREAAPELLTAAGFVMLSGAGWITVA